MNNEIQTFSDDKFGSIRSVVIDGMPYFVGKDIALALNYANPQKAIRDHVDAEDKTANEAFSVHGTPLTLINESGLYSLILTSRLPSAKEFKRWVTAGVLPMIRKTGMYVTQESIANGDSTIPLRTLTPDDYLSAARLIATCKSDRLKIILNMLSKAGWELEDTHAVTSRVNTADIGPRIQRALTEQGLSWAELASITGFSADVLRSYRDGRRFPKPDRYTLLVSKLDSLLKDKSDELDDEYMQGGKCDG